jgi:hypothetical protein
MTQQVAWFSVRTFFWQNSVCVADTPKQMRVLYSTAALPIRKGKNKKQSFPRA